MYSGHHFLLRLSDNAAAAFPCPLGKGKKENREKKGKRGSGGIRKGNFGNIKGESNKMAPGHL